MLRKSLSSQVFRPSARHLSSAQFHAHKSLPLLLPPRKFQSNDLLLRNSPISHIRISQFHSTPRREGGPWIYPILAVLKSSAAIEVARTAGRIALTFVPVLLLKNYKSRKYIQYADSQGTPASEEKKGILLKRIRNRTILFHILLLTPAIFFWAAIMASLERTPLTGRWRMIILAPEEEDEIAAQLAGPGWYQAVGDILSQESPPQYIPTNDWRYVWVQDTLRKLERTIPILQKEGEMGPSWLERGSDDIPLPPPAEYPLRPRPRASEYLRWCHGLMANQSVPPARHAIPGPPYSLLLVEKPDASNAFSYGFGPDGAGGVVVYSGFLDDILSKMPLAGQDIPAPPPTPSWWSYLLGGLLPQSQPRPPHPIPTDEQTSELAILLAHELAHLVLSHHLETLSSGTIVVPGILSIISDIVRVLVFPVTMLFGPFVNDAVAQLGKVGSSELVKVGEYCTSMKQEVEADVVSARLLAHAGYDARQAVTFWENRQTTPKTAECSSAKARAPDSDQQPLARRIMSAGHPANEIRVEKLKTELLRWENERQEALNRLAANERP